jgi:Nitroreductase
MSNQFTFSDSQLLEKIIEYRRSVRQFRTDLPGRELITSIINAGLWAPYAGLAVNGGEDFRKFYVITSEKGFILERINDIIKEFSKGMLIQFEKTIEENTFVKEHGANFNKRLLGMTQGGVAGLTQAPCLIIVSEKKGIPSAEKQSLAHVMENMWLKATSLNLGFRLLSAFESLGDNKEFCDVLGVEYGKYAFNACIIGFALNDVSIGKRPKIEDVVKWL